jgi:rubrerythrin
MAREVTDLLDIAMDREIVSEAFYTAYQKRTQDPGAIKLMQELAQEELKHYQWIKNLKDTGQASHDWHQQKLPDLKISEYLMDINITEGAGLQDVITVAIKREQSSVEFYININQMTENKAVRQLCEKLIQAERNHKAKLEIFYEGLFYQEN